MGSPVYRVVANLVMEDDEERALTNAPVICFLNKGFTGAFNNNNGSGRINGELFVRAISPDEETRPECRNVGSLKVVL